MQAGKADEEPHTMYDTYIHTAWHAPTPPASQHSLPSFIVQCIQMWVPREGLPIQTWLATSLPSQLPPWRSQPAKWQAAGTATPFWLGLLRSCCTSFVHHQHAYVPHALPPSCLASRISSKPHRHQFLAANKAYWLAYSQHTVSVHCRADTVGHTIT
jgi:hypothetical protein